MDKSSRIGTPLEKPHAYAWEKEYATGRSKWRGTTNYQMELPKGSKILEIGVGNGKTLTSFLNKGWAVYAIDVSPSAVKIAKQVVKEANAKAELSVGDAAKLEFKDKFFDAVFLFHVLGHLSAEDRKLAVKEAFRVLKKGGKCYFREFGISDYRFGKGIEVEKNTFRKGTNVWVHYFEEGEVKEAFEREGFKVIKVFIDSYKHIFRGKDYPRCEMDFELEK
jgi:MPBQ/MSBQ methyltransferase